MREEIIKFIREKDYVFVKELGRGACGKTVLLYDDVLKMELVCKKFQPTSGDIEVLFKNFKEEIKFLFHFHHPNIVRIFNYHLYPSMKAGYILMEHVDGVTINKFLQDKPESIDQVFLQVIKGFSCLENNNFLHRDIRKANIMVSKEGIVKIIDFGFGKIIETDEDFQKSISLNMWCEKPLEYQDGIYDFKTQVYFVGMIFDALINEHSISHFTYKELLLKMCALDPINRISSFSAIENYLKKEDISSGIEFYHSEKVIYRKVADGLCSIISKLDEDCKYLYDDTKVMARLYELCQNNTLEIKISNNSELIKCFLKYGSFVFSTNAQINVRDIELFQQLFNKSSAEKRNIILRNLYSRFDALEKRSVIKGDDIPF